MGLTLIKLKDNAGNDHLMNAAFLIEVTEGEKNNTSVLRFSESVSLSDEFNMGGAQNPDKRQNTFEIKLPVGRLTHILTQQKAPDLTRFAMTTQNPDRTVTKHKQPGVKIG